MAIYSTFFLAAPHELLPAFPGWRLPLPEPVTRTFMHPYFRREVTVTSRAPDWNDTEFAEPTIPEYRVVTIQGDYGQYLESRIPGFVRSQSHCCLKALTIVELQPLINELLGPQEVKLESALYAPPSMGADILEIPTAAAEKVGKATHEELRMIAEHWAARMSAPEHTHSVTGNRISDGWTPDQALQYLQPMAALCSKRTGDQILYLLTEC